MERSFQPARITLVALTLLTSATQFTAATQCWAEVARPTEKGQAAKVEFFEKKVRPILVDHCYTCHSAETKPSGGLRVDDRAGLLSGGDSGPAVVPGHPDQSLLLQRLTHKEVKRRMPKEGPPLDEDKVADVRRWIEEGAAWPALEVPESIGKPRPEYAQLRREHWAWQPLARASVPHVKDATWPRDELDHFILARLESQQLSPVGDATREALIRRLTFDLTGLPPTPVEIDAFLSDNEPDAYVRLVDRLLAAPQFGERWGRHWLDVARYGESTGPSRNIPYPMAWKYRNYVIDAINADIPFDRFLQEQIAGDLLPAASKHERDRLLTATGFLAIGVKDVNQRFKVRFVMDNVDEQIDVVSRSVLALTVTCARCHDHKFDPIPTADYYALAGIFASTDNCAGVRNKMGGGGLDYYDPSMLLVLSTDLPPVPAERIKKLTAEFEQAKKAWDDIRGTPEGVAKGPDGLPKQRPYRMKFEKLRGELLALTDPAARGYAVHGVREAKVIADTEIRLRGEAEKLGPPVPRGFLSLLPMTSAPSVPTERSGRLELAQWLTSPQNPLTARVAVNRVWHHLFGQGLVTTVDNFGTTGDTPSHPELLDHLAARFIQSGWSIKKLVRSVVLSRAYHLDTAAPAKHRTIDPGNRLVWRHSPRRLDSEELRDAMLAVAGMLDRRRPESAAVQELKMVEIRDNGPEARRIGAKTDLDTHRSVYLPALRGVVPRALEAFDPVEQTLVSGSRDATTVPGQALYLLNSSFVQRQSLALAYRLLDHELISPLELVGNIYHAVLGRAPSGRETERATAFLADYESLYRRQIELAARENVPAQAVEAMVERTPPPAPVSSAPPANPDEMVQTDEPIVDEIIEPRDARSAAWMAFIQALFASAEFRYLN